MIKANPQSIVGSRGLSAFGWNLSTRDRQSSAGTKQLFILMAFAVTMGFLIPASGKSAVTLDNGGLQSPFELGGSARALGMGDTAVAVTGDGDSFFSNPAALATISQNEILTFHAPLLLDTLYDAAGYVNPISSHASFGLGFARIATDDIPKTQNNIQALSTFSTEQLQGLVGYGFRVMEGLDFGASVKYLREQVDTYQGSGVGVDLGLLYHFGKEAADYRNLGYKNFTLGVSASNVLQPQVKLVQAADYPARVLRPALSYHYQPSASSSLWVAFEGEMMTTGSPLIKAGVEYGFNEMVFARAGFDGANPTAGAGFRISGIEIDYAFNQGDLGALHRFSLTYRFGQFRDPLQAQKIDLLKWVARSYTKSGDYDPAIQSWKNVLTEYPGDEEASRSIRDLQQKRRDAVGEQLNAAREAVHKGDFDKALPLLARIMILDPGNPDAKALLKQVDKNMVVSTNYIRGVEAYSKEDFEMAVQYLQSVYELDPNYRDVKFLYHDAQGHYMPLQSMSKELTDLYAKGVDYYMGGQYRKAIESWEQVLAKDPKNFLVLRNLEEARARLKDKPEAAPAENKEPKK